MSIVPLLREATSRDTVAEYYDAKTESILRRYGPGPRVHYHTGVVEDVPPPGMTAEALRVLIHEAQETLLRELALAAGRPTLGQQVLDVGCGLGGGALFWAIEYSAQVTAITIAPTHVPWVKRFAEQAGVANRVEVRLCDALEVPGQECFDHVVAVESACYLPRPEWFLRLRTLLRPGGTVALADCFLGRPELAAPFDRYWRTRIGPVEEYFRAASAAGLELELHQDLSYRTVNFWTLTLDLLAREQEELRRRGAGHGGRSESQREHLRLQQALLDGGLHHALMVLRRRR